MIAPRYAVEASGRASPGRSDQASPGRSLDAAGEGWLCRDGRQLLGGPRAALEQFADLLNLMDPPRRRLPDVVRACMAMARGCVFTPGAELRRIGRAS